MDPPSLKKKLIQQANHRQDKSELAISRLEFFKNSSPCAKMKSIMQVKIWLLVQ